MNKSITMKTALAALACTACVSASAQKQYPEQEKMKPGMSEYWTPQPKVVTPGDIKTNSAPSDAIVLFDGKDLSAWQNAKGGPAEWIVKDGVFTVDKKKGDILTKQKFENFQLQIEWCVPENITGTSQGRGNSGIFLQDMYEIQVLDCYNNETYVNGQTGSVSKPSIMRDILPVLMLRNKTGRDVQHHFSLRTRPMIVSVLSFHSCGYWYFSFCTKLFAKAYCHC